MYVLFMKMKNFRLEDKLAIWVYFVAFYISLNIIGGLLFNILGVLFFAAMAYGIVCIYKNFKFVF